MRGCNYRNAVGRFFMAATLFSGSLFVVAQADPLGSSGASRNASLYLKVQLGQPLKFSKLQPGDLVEGELARDVYSSDREVFAAGSHVRLTVERMEKRRRVPNDHWPWVVKAFTPRHENFPVFKTASFSGANGQSDLQVSLISINRKREIHPQAKKKGSSQSAVSENGAVEIREIDDKKRKKSDAPMIVLEAVGAGDESSANPTADSSTTTDASQLKTLPAGTACKILLLTDVSASKSKPGDPIQARLLEPVFQNSRLVLPAGSQFEGKVLQKTPPRWGSRAGSLSLTFTSLILPGGNRIPIAASLTGAELDKRSHTQMDAEGKLHGERPGAAWMAINIGVTAGLAKEVDDATQLIIEAIVSTATDVSTAGTARIVSTCISGIYIVSRHGRDVMLPRFTEMDIALDRPLSVTDAPAAGIPPLVVHGN